MNIGNMMKQVQQMQTKMADMQQKLAETQLEGASGGGMVRATMNGKSELTRLKIDPSLVDPNDIEVLEDLIIAAIRDAKTKIDAHAAEEMAQVTGGMKLPGGMNLPF